MVPRTASGPAALLRRRLAFVPFQHAHPCRRLYSTPLPTPGPTDKEHTADHPPPPLAAPKKPRLDLRPAPIKPKPPSSTPAPKVQSKPTQAASALHVPTLPSLGAAKEEAKHDIREAEAHGVLEPPPEGATWLQRTLHQVIQIAKFYYRGTKLIFTRRKAIAAITARVRAGGEPLTRAEFRLITTQKDDITKLVPFLVIALLLEEVIPLIAIYAPFMLPSTCILPSQRARIDAQRAEKARAYAVVHAPLFAALAADARDSARLPLAALARPDAAEVVCGCLGLSTIGPNALRLRRIRRHLSFIVRDDEMLLKDTAPLSRAELVDALEERGIRTSSEEPYKALQAHLLAWLDAVRSAGPDSEDAVPRRLALVVKHAEELVARP